MNNKVPFLIVLLVSAIAVLAADVSGKWVYEQAGPGGNRVQVTLTLRADGSSLTGKVSIAGPNGNIDANISNGKVDGNKISFEVERQIGVTTYKGALVDDTLKLDITRPGRGGPGTITVTARRCPPDCG